MQAGQNFTVDELAAEFSLQVRLELSAEQLAEVRRLNQTPDYAGCCATHDYTDANMLMLAAYATLAGVDQDDVDSTDDATLAKVNAAWDIAKASGFGMPPPTYSVKESAVHTPGPWEADTALTVEFNKLADAISMKCGDGSDAQQAANYKVLRSAPVLAEALRRLFYALESDLHGQIDIRAAEARAALTKAGLL